jgi:hypothetical protein
VGDLNGDSLTDVVLSDPTTITTLLNTTPTDSNPNNPPTASVDSTQANGSTQSSIYQFTVTYHDSQQVDAQTLGDDDLTVAAPAGVTFSNGQGTTGATLISTGLVSAASVQATYQVSFSTTLVTADNGTYTVTMNPSSVKNAGGIAVTAGSIGTFALNVDSGTKPPPNPNAPSGDLTPSAPHGKINASVVAGSKQKGVSVVVINTSNKIIAGKNVIAVTLHTSATNIVDNTSTVLGTFVKKVKNLKPGKGFVAHFKPFAYPSVAGSYYLVADATVNGTADSYDGATASPIVDAAAFVDMRANSVAPVKPLLVAGAKNAAILNITNIGNVLYSGGATIAVFASTTGLLDGTQTQIASVPVTLHITPSQTKVLHFSFIPTSLPASGSYKLIATITVPGDNNALNNTVASATTVSL